MANYYEVKGQKIQTLTTDPNPAVEGQVWYNSSLQSLRTYQSFTEAWSTGGNLNVARQALGGDGSQTAALAAGGAPPRTAATEEYNGTSWTAGGDLSTARTETAAAGTIPAGLLFGGGTPPAPKGINDTEEYDGTSWTAGGSMGNPGGRSYHMGCGTQTAALAISGLGPPPNFANDPDGITNVEEYDGSSWTAGGAVTIRKAKGAGVGIQTAALAWGGNYPPSINNAEEYDGTSWTAAPTLNTATQQQGGLGTQTAALSFGGGQPAGNTTEKYDGTSWTTTVPMVTARRQLAGAGTTSAGLAYGGLNGSLTPSNRSETEEWNAGPFLAAAEVG